jgi:hypothetical protein
MGALLIASMLASALALNPPARVIVRVPARAPIASARAETDDREKQMDQVRNV